ncbi:unnamed protein product [Moneuplotes crassus]|uniref:Regulator of telomere elongation helicase 1 homolog n=1 Tax=Euplotes crassus TaxID=5936 RepID=A0AAD2D729_EUPCR|nr:unnamed protein product [Moneuplotes crassus]
MQKPNIQYEPDSTQSQPAKKREKKLLTKQYNPHVSYDPKKAKGHHKYTILGTQCYFPYQAYDLQQEFMTKVVQACQQGENALLESPTGTGKTLALLTSILGWVRSERTVEAHDDELPPKIIYCSRTHSQLNQVIKELKATAYKPRMVLVGSRDQMCVNPKLSEYRGAVLNSQCKKAIKNPTKLSGCQYESNLNRKLKNNIDIPFKMFDIEELHTLGERHKICPFYLQRHRISEADVLLMPYNYIFSSSVSRSLDIQFENSIIIFDEGHNIPKVCEEASSFEISIGQISEIQGKLNILKKKMMSNDTHEEFESDLTKVDNFKFLLTIISERIKNWEQEPIQKPIDQEKRIIRIFTGDKIYNFLFCKRETYEGRPDFRPLVPKHFSYWLKVIDDLLVDTTVGEDSKRTPQLKNFYDCLKKLIGIYTHDNDAIESQKDINHYYSVLIEEKIEEHILKKLKKHEIEPRKKSNRKIGFWCFNPAVGFNKIMKLSPRSIILTSGTLNPMDEFAQELGTDFNIRLENPHVIQKQQVQVSILKNGPNTRFNFKYENRKSTEMMLDLLNVITDICRVTPGGVLVFFPSYQLMKSVIKICEEQKIDKKIEKYKSFYEEPRQSAHYPYVISAYYNDVYSKGSLMFGVCRGKIAEGLDFSDDAARAVIVVGVPYPMKIDPKTILKEKYLDNIRKIKKKGVSSKHWYQTQATRATNQAIGRVIRHSNDYGNIILIDERYENPENKSAVSAWLRDQIKVFSNSELAIQQYQQFYEDMKKLDLKPKVQAVTELELDDIDENDDHFKGVKDQIIEDASKIKAKAIKKQKLEKKRKSRVRYAGGIAKESQKITTVLKK